MARSILLIAGTGKQGRSLSAELLQRGYEVHALTRDASSQIAQEMSASGVVLHTANLNNATSVRAAMDGIDAVFLALPASPTNEVEHATHVIDAAREKGVEQLVYSSVARTGDHLDFPGWTDANPMAWYWTNKQKIEDMVRSANFKFWTILRPAFFMQNFCRPVCEHLFPGLAESRELRFVFEPDTRLDLIDIADIAKFGANAFDSPTKYAGNAISLAAEKLTAAEIAGSLAVASGKAVVVKYLTDSDVLAMKAAGQDIEWQLWQRDVGYAVDLDALNQYPVRLTRFSEALKRETLGW